MASGFGSGKGLRRELARNLGKTSLGRLLLPLQLNIHCFADLFSNRLVLLRGTLFQPPVLFFSKLDLCSHHDYIIAYHVIMFKLSQPEDITEIGTDARTDLLGVFL
jgi:hypothetical protein